MTPDLPVGISCVQHGQLAGRFCFDGMTAVSH